MEGKTSTKPHAKNEDGTQNWIFVWKSFVRFQNFMLHVCLSGGCMFVHLRCVGVQYHNQCIWG